MRRPPAAALMVTGAGLMALSEVSPLVQWSAGFVLLVMAIRFWVSRPISEGLGNACILTLLVILTTRGIGEPQRAPEWLALALLGLQAHRMWQWVMPKDSRILALLALVQLVLAGSQSTSPTFLLAVIVWALSAMRCFWVVPIHRLRQQMGTSALLLGVAGLLFLILPRVQSPAMEPGASPDAHIGFSDQVALGDLGALLDNQRPVLRIQGLPNTEEMQYFRGVALDYFDGQTWSRSVTSQPVVMDERQVSQGSIQVFAEPEAKGIVFTTGPVDAVQSAFGRLERDANDNWFLSGVQGSVQYTLALNRNEALAGPDDAARYLQLPEEIDRSVLQLATEMGADVGTPTERAEVIQSWFSQAFTYTRVPEKDAEGAPLQEFLLRSRRGHCEYFASGAAILLRSQGIPARVVTGFLGGEFNQAGQYWLVRQEHAHAWVEFVDASGRWARLDTTPQTMALPQLTSLWTQGKDTVEWLWRSQVIAYDRKRQWTLAQTPIWSIQNIFQQGSQAERPTLPWVGIFLSLGALFGGGWSLRFMWIRLRRRWFGSQEGRDGIARVHQRMWDLLRKYGYRPREELPPLTKAEHIAEKLPEGAEDVYALVWLYYRVVYGGEEEAPLLTEAEACYSRIQAAMNT